MFLRAILILTLTGLFTASCANSGSNTEPQMSATTSKDSASGEMAGDVSVPLEDSPVLKIFNITAQFPSGSANLTSEAKTQIKSAGDYIKGNDKKIRMVFIEGHSDSQGQEEFNRLLSERRAQMVKNYLVRSFGVSDEKVKAIGFGESSPIADNNTMDGRKKNRRVIIKVK